jgi:hypothetical protein
MSKFGAGNISFTVYRADPFPSGDYGQEIPQMLGDNALAGDIGTTPSVGWSNRYPGDADFDHHNVMVTDTTAQFMHVEAVRKAPASAVAAYARKMEIKHMDEQDISMLSRRTKNEIKKEAEDVLSKDTPVSYSSVDVVYVADEGYLLIASTSVKTCDKIVSRFMETFGVNVYPSVAGGMCPTYSNNDHEPIDLRSENTSGGLEDNSMIFGRDFLMWLWYTNEEAGGVDIMLFEDLRRVDIGFDGPLQFINDAAVGAQQVKVGKGLPTLSVEAQKAIGNGKKLQKAKISFALGKDIYTFTFDADMTTYSGTSLPDGDAMSSLDRIAERVDMMINLDEIIKQLVHKFAEDACDYPSRQRMLDWATNRIHHS